jgi:hypothetical protein
VARLDEIALVVRGYRVHAEQFLRNRGFDPGSWRRWMLTEAEKQRMTALELVALDLSREVPVEVGAAAIVLECCELVSEALSAGSQVSWRDLTYRLVWLGEAQQQFKLMTDSPDSEDQMWPRAELELARKRAQRDRMVLDAFARHARKVHEEHAAAIANRAAERWPEETTVALAARNAAILVVAAEVLTEAQWRLTFSDFVRKTHKRWLKKLSDPKQASESPDGPRIVTVRDSVGEEAVEKILREAGYSKPRGESLIRFSGNS